MPKKFTEKQEELKGLFQELFPQLMEDAKAEVVKEDEEVQKLKESNKELKDRIEAIEKAPAKKVNLIVPGEDKTVEAYYKGHRLENQGGELTLPEEKKERIAKMLIDFIETKAAMNETTAAQGGYTVFDEYVSELLALARLQSVMLQEARVIDVGSDVVHWPAEDSNVSVAWYAEAAAIAASDPTFKEITLTPKKIAAYSTASNELLADTEFDIVSVLTSQFAEAIGQEVDSQVMNGAQFTALLGAAGINSVQTLTNTVAGLSDWRVASNAVAQLSSNKTAGAKWYMHRTFIHYYRIMKDELTNGVYVPSTNQMPASVFGFPIVEVEAMPTDSTASSVIALLGNMKNYIIARRKGEIVLDVDPYGRFLNDQTRFRVTNRYHGMPSYASAFCEIQV